MSVGMVSSKQKWDLVSTIHATVLQQIRCLCTECMLSDILHVLHVTARTGTELRMCMTGGYSKTTLHTIAGSAQQNKGSESSRVECFDLGYS
jgi:hypothetical protein